MKALITGASSGIGQEIARELAARGYELILVARRRDRLEALARELTVKCRIFEMDLSDVEQCRMLYCRARGEDLDILVNNAGFGLCGSFAATSLDRDLEMIRTNITAVHVLTKLFLHDFRLKNHGYILNVASSAGFMAGPLMATYYATKNYVLRLTEAIREELRREGSAVQISALCPGPVKTEFNEVAEVKFSLPGMDAKRCAKAAVRGMFKGRPIIVPGVGMKTVLAAHKFAPEWLVPRITYHVQQKKLQKKKK
nr:SDR family oxidoreductase [uncultured Butyricicoccus sp.]